MMADLCIEALRKHLAADSSRARTPGKILYSFAAKLQRFPIYFLGTNPGGSLPNTLRIGTFC